MLNKKDFKNIDYRKKGILISIEGIDGAGKKTQTSLLSDKLKREGYDVKTISFPQYGKKSAGMTEIYLEGKYGKANEVSPYQASIFYACDRFDASFIIKKWLSEGKVVISDRYVFSNLGHQGANIENALERKNFFDWNMNLEHKIFNMPKTDITILLDIKPEQATKQYLARKLKKNPELNTDILENSRNHIYKASLVYNELASNYPEIKKINCMDDDIARPKNDISQEIYNLIIKTIKNNSFELKNNLAIDFAPNFKKAHDADEKISNHLNNTLKVKRLSENAKIPTQNQESDSGLNLFCSDYYTLYPGERAAVSTGIKIKIPKNHIGIILDIKNKPNPSIQVMPSLLTCANNNEIFVNIVNLGHDIHNITPGEKLAGLLIQKPSSPAILEV